MKPSSSPQRLRLLVGVAVLAAILVALVVLAVWKRSHSGRDSYRDMVSAFYTGVIALQVGDTKHAFSELTLATQIDAQEPAAWADLGLFYLRNNNPDEARKALTKAQDLAPKNAQILALSGLLETQQGHFPEAVTVYRQAIQLDPGDLRARYALEEALQQQGGPDADREGCPADSGDL